MKKILFVLLALVFTASFAYAEQSAQTYSANQLQSYREQQVFSDFYNNSGATIGSNSVVILDTSVASGALLGTAITLTTASNSSLVVGVADTDIATAKVGRVCVRGPHKCFVASTANMVAGATLGTTNAVFTYTGPQTGIGNGPAAVLLSPGTAPNTGVFGTLLSATQIKSSSEGLSSGDGPWNYWVYIGGASAK